MAIARKYAEVFLLFDSALKDIEFPSTEPELRLLKENKVNESEHIMKNVIELNKLIEVRWSRPSVTTKTWTLCRPF